MVQEKGVPIGPINSEIRKVQCSSLRYKSNDKNHNMKGICYVSLLARLFQARSSLILRQLFRVDSLYDGYVT